ncbi:hypothetical protein KKE60_05085 [Patescibacteria group bacterium]|nr:hypothetical protein [Patescibacteria group bacterium]
MKLTLKRDKVTPGTVRYKETGDAERPLVIYLLKEQVKELNDPETISVVIEKES